MNASPFELLSLGLIGYELEGIKLAVSAPLFARHLSVPIRFLPSLSLAFDEGYCYNLFGSTRVLQGFPARCFAYFPISAVGFSA